MSSRHHRLSGGSMGSSQSQVRHDKCRRRGTQAISVLWLVPFAMLVTLRSLATADEPPGRVSGSTSPGGIARRRIRRSRFVSSVMGSLIKRP